MWADVLHIGCLLCLRITMLELGALVQTCHIVIKFCSFTVWNVNKQLTTTVVLCQP